MECRLMRNNWGRDPASIISSLFSKSSSNIILLVIFVFSILAIPSAFHYRDYIELSIKGPIQPDDDELLDYIRKEVLIAPSSQPYNLLGEANPARLHIETSEQFYTNASKVLFNNKMEGYFVEAGALDGESMSNTLLLESKHNWKGLLVEADSTAFQSMVGKHRKAWLANACLSPFSYPEKLLFGAKSELQESLWKGYVTFGFKMRSMNGLASYLNPKFRSNMLYHSIQCLPLESLLLALDVTTVDLLSLDVEGAEWDILQELPLQKFNVQVIYMEWTKSLVFPLIQEFFYKNGYKLFKNITNDFIFVKETSPYIVSKPKLV